MDITRLLIEPAVDKAIRDIRRDPQRSLRNAIDLGANFSKGRFQQYFMQTAQRMLENEQSAYYPLAQRVVDDVSPATLKTFGINIGYQSFTKGAKTIRTLEAEKGFNIPWALEISYDASADGCSLDQWDRTLREGKEMGIYTAFIWVKRDSLASLVPLLVMHKECAFILHITDALDEAAADLLATLTNLMVCLSGPNPGYAASAAMLKARGCLYAADFFYDTHTLEKYRQDDWLKALLPSGCIFVFLHAAQYTPPIIQQTMRQHVIGIREAQQHPLLVMEYASDLMYIDQVISDEPCGVYMDAKGFVYRMAPPEATGENVCGKALLDVLAQTMPKTRYFGG